MKFRNPFKPKVVTRTKYVHAAAKGAAARRKPLYAQRANGYFDIQRGVDADGLAVQRNAIPTLNYGATTTYNYDILTALWRMRRMSRDEYQGDPYFRRAVRLTQRNVVGKGVQVKPQPRMADGNVFPALSADMKRQWERFGKRGVPDVTGRLSWLDIEYQAIFSMMVDGEFLAVIHDIEGEVKLQVLEPWRLGNETATLGNRFMGLELNPFGKVSAYHIAMPDYSDGSWTAMQGAVPTGQTDLQRLPAERVIHLFDPEFPEQLRGMPPLVTTIQRLRNLVAYEESEQQAASISAGPIGFLTRNETGGGFSTPSAVDEAGNPLDANGNPVTSDGKLELDMSPGAVNEIDYNAQFQAFDPNHPNTAYADFVSGALRGAASGADLSHTLLSQDTRGVNFSTLRQFALEQRDVWARWQRILVDGLHERVYKVWLDKQIVTKRIDTTGADVDRIGEAVMVPRTHEHIQPREASVADDLALKNGTKSRSAVIRASGNDPLEVDEEIAEDKQRAADLGLSFGAATSQPARPEPEPDDEADDKADAATQNDA